MTPKKKVEKPGLSDGTRHRKLKKAKKDVPNAPSEDTLDSELKISEVKEVSHTHIHHHHGKKKHRHKKKAIHPEKNAEEDPNEASQEKSATNQKDDPNDAAENTGNKPEKEEDELTTMIMPRRETATVISLFANAGLDIEIVPDDTPSGAGGKRRPTLGATEQSIRNRNTWSVESFEATTDRVFQGKYLAALRPYVRTLVCFGRFPSSVFMKDIIDANPYYEIRWTSARAIWCLIISSINFILCLWTWIACLLFFADLVHGSDHNQIYWRYLRSHEMILFKRNITTFIIFQMCLFHLFLTQLLVLYKRDFNCKYSTLWLESVELLRLHCVTGIRLFFWLRLGIFIFFTLLLVGFFSAGYFHICQGTGAMLGMILLRIFDPKIVMWDANDFHAVRIFGMVIFVYVFMIAKFSAVQFAIRCRLINNLIGVWNRRFRVCLHGTPEEQMSMIRSSRAYLFKDHCVWVNILEGANNEILIQIETFFVMLCVSFIYELHHIVRSMMGKEFDWNRFLDVYVCATFLIIDLYFFYNAGIQAGLITETVSESYDVIREKGVLSRKVDQEVTFMMSLQLSLMGSTDERGMGLVGWEFVYYSKTFMLVALGFSASFFVMLWQYQQPTDQYIGNDINCDRVNVREFLNKVMNNRVYWPNEPTHKSSCNRDYKVYLNEETN